jgi:hypothetical protein
MPIRIESVYRPRVLVWDRMGSGDVEDREEHEQADVEQDCEVIHLLGRHLGTHRVSMRSSVWAYSCWAAIPAALHLSLSIYQLGIVVTPVLNIRISQ